MAGVHQASLLQYQGISNIPEVVFESHRIDGEITIKSGYNWESPYFTESSSVHSEKEVSLDGDSHFEQMVELFLPFSDHDQTYLQTLRERMRFVVDLIDRDGNRRLVGTKKEPLNILHTFSTQKGIGGRKGTVILLQGNTTERAYFYNPTGTELEYTSGSGI